MGKDVYHAFCRAYEADPVSIFGGIVAVNRQIDVPTAEKMSEIFLEVIIAPSYDEEAKKILMKKKDLRLLEAPLAVERDGLDLKKVSGGLLLQTLNPDSVSGEGWKNVTERQPTQKELADMVFGMKVVKHVKSNAIVLVKDGRTVGIGAGQMNRVGAAEIALKQAGEKAAGSVLASDAFFPFRDTVDAAAKGGVAAIVQPGGSVRDQDSIAACNEYGLAMVFTGIRYFKH